MNDEKSHNIISKRRLNLNRQNCVKTNATLRLVKAKGFLQIYFSEKNKPHIKYCTSCSLVLTITYKSNHGA